MSVSRFMGATAAAALLASLAGGATTDAHADVRTSAAATKGVQPVSRTATYAGGKASIRLSNPNRVPVRGRLRLKLGKKLAGSRRYSIAAGSESTVGVKLARAPRKRLAQQGKLRLSLSITARGTSGATRRTSAALTVRTQRPDAPPPTDERSALNGRYERESGGPTITFTVTGGGRSIASLTGLVGGICFTYVPFQGVRSELRGVPAGVDSIPVAPDGSFSGTQEIAGTTTEITGGMLAGGVATGKVRVKSSGCQGEGDFRSRRTGP